MRVALIGATGNVGTSLLQLLERDPRVTDLIGVARRPCALIKRSTRFVRADIGKSDLTELFTGVDTVVHLAWQVQPARDEDRLWLTNIEGSRRVFDAAVRAGVKALVYASSVGAYSRGPKDRFVDESWSCDGIPTSTYSRHKAEVERQLDELEHLQPALRVVRLRPALIFKKEAATSIRRLFLGPLLPRWLIRPGTVPLLPALEHLRFQALHSFDAARAFQAAIFDDETRGAYNLAAEPVLDNEKVAELLRARLVRFSERAMRGVLTTSFRLHLQRSNAGWLDLVLGSPLVDPQRAREELDWRPRYSATEALAELLEGLREGSALPTPPLGRGPQGRWSEGVSPT